MGNEGKLVEDKNHEDWKETRRYAMSNLMEREWSK